MVRVTDNERWSFSDSPNAGVRDYAALVGLRARAARLFVAGAAGVARGTPIGGDDDVGMSRPFHRLAAAYDLSAHADSRVAGLSVSVSGVLGPASTRYAAISLGVELGWFGSK